MISARSGVWLRSAGPGGCWWKPDGSLALHIVASCLLFGIGSDEGRRYLAVDSMGQVDAVYIGQINYICNANI